VSETEALRARLAFFCNRGGKWEIWMINSDGSGLKQLTYASATVTEAIWTRILRIIDP
jgi:hypothetical protein